MQNMLREYKASIFQALAHPTRIAIVEALRDGEISTRAIQERLGEEVCTDAEVRQVVLRLAAIFASDRVPPPTNVLILGIGGSPPDDG